MTRKYQAYPEYKESGSEWLSVIPLCWSLSRHKYIASFQKGKNPKVLMDEPHEGTVKYLSMDYLRGNATPSFANLEINTYVSKKDQVLIIWDGSNAGEFVKGQEGIVSSTMAASEILSDIDHDFYWYACICLEPEMRKHATGMGIPHVNGNELKDAIIPLPEKEEQQKIANFLDHETDKIDTLIEKQQQLIKLLKEKRLAVISHFVTKGLNPNAPMRDSGVVSIGLMPEHWTLKSLSLASKKLAVGLAMSVTDCYEDEGVPIIRNQNIKEGYFDGSDMLYLNPAFAEAQASKKVLAGDVVIVRTGSNVGLTCCVPDEYDQCHTFTTLIVTPSGELFNKYFTYCMNSAYGKAEVNRLKFGFGKDNLNVGELRAMYTLLPSVAEQYEIVSFLDEEVAKIDLMVKKAHLAIRLMHERRVALISAAVTGNIDVRNWKAPDLSNTTSNNNKEVAA